MFARKRFALLAVLGLLTAAYILVIAPATTPARAQFGSYVDADLTVHTAILSAADGGSVASSSSTHLTPQTASEAAFLSPKTLSFDGTFRTLRATEKTSAECKNNLVWTTLTTDASDQLRIGQTVITGAVQRDATKVLSTMTRYSRAAGTAEWVYAGSFQTSDGSFRAGVWAAGGESTFYGAKAEGSCPKASRILTAPADHSTQPPPPDTTPPTTPPPPAEGKVNIPVTVEGTMETKNIAQGVRVAAVMKLVTAAGDTFSKTVNVEVPAKGGAVSGLAHTFTDIGLGRVHGKNTITVTVTASSTDHAGKSVSDTKSVSVEKTVDASGTIKISIKPASLVMTGPGLDGSPLVVKRTLVARPLELKLR